MEHILNLVTPQMMVMGGIVVVGLLIVNTIMSLLPIKTIAVVAIGCGAYLYLN